MKTACFQANQNKFKYVNVQDNILHFKTSTKKKKKL